MLCKFCNKECKNANSLRNHERLCKLNPDHQTTCFNVNNSKYKVRCGYSNQYIKAKALGLDKSEVSLETRQKLSNSIKSRSPEWNKANGEKIAKTVAEKVANGTWHTSLAKNMHINYKGNDLHGKWELRFAEYLDENGINWIRNKDSFAYEFENKTRSYTPDFYLIDSDEYIEIKGYKTEKDSAKWSQFPKHRKLRVYMGKDLKELGLKI